MPLTDLFTKYASSGIFTASAVTVIFWKADDFISKDGRNALTELLTQTVACPQRSNVKLFIDQFLDAYVSPKLPARKFIMGILLISLLSISVTLAVYLAKTDGLFAQLMDDSTALNYFLRQTILDGFLLVFLVNCFSFSIYGYFVWRYSHAHQITIVYLILEAVAKMAVFVFATAIIYVIFAQIFGSFGGSSIAALKSVRPTIEGAMRFDNLTGVYFYAVAISSFPLFICAMVEALADNAGLAFAIGRLFYWLPVYDNPVRAIVVIFSIFAGFLAALTTIILRLI